MKIILIMLCIIGLFIVGMAWLNQMFLEEQKSVPAPVGFCTMDARICPDGTAVGRIPPSCDFAPCP